MGNLATVLLAALIFGYGGYQLWKTFKKGAQGQCGGCAHTGDCQKGSCPSDFGYVDLSSLIDEEDNAPGVHAEADASAKTDAPAKTDAQEKTRVPADKET